MVFVATCAHAAFGQTEGRAPAGAVFGGTGSGQTGSSLKVDIAEAYDQDLQAGPDGTAASTFHGGGLYSMLTPQMDFQTSGRVQLHITAISTARYYGELHEVIATNHSAAVSLLAQLTPRTSISLNPSVAYSPALFGGVFANFGSVTAASTALPGSNDLLNTNRSPSTAAARDQPSNHGAGRGGVRCRTASHNVYEEGTRLLGCQIR